MLLLPLTGLTLAALTGAAPNPAGRAAWRTDADSKPVLMMGALARRTTGATDTTSVRDTTPVEPRDGLPRPADSTLVVLTPDLLARFTIVWTAVQKDSAAMNDSTMMRDSIPFVIRDSIFLDPSKYPAGTPRLVLDHEHGWIPFPTLRSVAAKDPKIAAAIRRSGLPPEQVLRIARALALAWSDNLYWIIDQRNSKNFRTHFMPTKAVDTTTLMGKNMLFFRAHRRQIEELGLLKI